MNCGITDQSQLEDIENALNEDLTATGVDCLMLVDTAGNVLSSCARDYCNYDVSSFAALAAGNYATVDSMAQIVGEQEISQLFHRGEKISIHFSKVTDELLLITIFDKELSLGFVRLRIGELAIKIKNICQR